MNYTKSEWVLVNGCYYSILDGVLMCDVARLTGDAIATDYVPGSNEEYVAEVEMIPNADAPALVAAFPLLQIDYMLECPK